MTIALAAVLGALVGAVTPRIAYRLSVAGGAPPRAACQHCDRPFPAAVAGWVRPGASCPGCRRRLGPRTWLTVAVGALSAGLVAWALGPVPALAPYLLAVAIGVPLAFVDLACLRLPDPVVAAMLAFPGVSLAVLALVEGEPGRLGRAALAGAACFAAYLVLALLPGAGLGFGDVKLAGVLGFLLGWLSWPAVLLALIVPHLINGPVALALLLTRRADRRTHLPLGPALLAGAVVALVIAV